MCANPTLDESDKSPNNLKLDLPPLNIFIPIHFELRKGKQDKYPKLIMSNKKTDLWHLFDLEFKMPKADLFLNIYLDDQNYTKDIKCSLLYKIWLKMFGKFFKETKDLASKVKQNISINESWECIHLNAWGYDDTIDRLMVAAVQSLTSYKVENE